MEVVFPRAVPLASISARVVVKSRACLPAAQFKSCRRRSRAHLPVLMTSPARPVRREVAGKSDVMRVGRLEVVVAAILLQVPSPTGSGIVVYRAPGTETSAGSR